jgi:hypothetical protein
MNIQIHAPATLSPRKWPSVPTGYEAGRDPEPVWTVWRKFLPLLGLEPQPLSRPARSQSLYRLHYLVPGSNRILKIVTQRGASWYVRWNNYHNCSMHPAVCHIYNRGQSIQKIFRKNKRDTTVSTFVSWLLTLPVSTLFWVVIRRTRILVVDLELRLNSIRIHIS